MLASSVVLRLADQARAGGRLAIDTEFVSESRYQALLCLVQVAVRDPEAEGGVRTEVIDPLDSTLDPSPLAAVLADPAVEKVVHAGYQDVALLKRSWQTEIRNIFDTQVAGGFLGLGAGQGYDSMVRRVLDVDLHGSEAFTRWDRRPLDEAQIGYARQDAHWLLLLGEALTVRLADAGRLEWSREESRALEEVTDSRDPDRLYPRLPRVASLSANGRAVARELIVWREETARKLDRTAASVLPDHSVVEVAKRMPSTPEALERLRGVPAQTVHRRGTDLLAAVARSRQREAPPLEQRGRSADPADAPLVALADALVRHRALEAGLATQLITNQAELTEVVAKRSAPEGSKSRVLTGWRNELVGAELLELLAGGRELSVGPEGRMEVGERLTVPSSAKRRNRVG